MIPKECKRLAEVDFPIAVVSRHAAREKKIFGYHPQMLNQWWARRPLASCRAMLLGLLLPDPCDPHCPPGFKERAASILLETPGWNSPRLNEQVRSDLGLRQALLKFIGESANWDVANNRNYISVARELVSAAHSGETPLVVDPFAGGGSIPLEALRLGCEAFASDLNPVACLILKVMLEDIPRHGPMLAEELRRAGGEIKKQAEKELAEFYPKDPDGALPIAYLWARTVRCESPNCGAEIPLVRSFWLCKKERRKRALRYEVHHRGTENGEFPHVVFEIFEPKTEQEVPAGTVTRANATCLCCGTVLPPERVRAQLAAQRGGADVIYEPSPSGRGQGEDIPRRIGGARMLAVVTLKPGEQGRHYRLPAEQDYAAVRKAQNQIKAVLDKWECGGRQGLCPVPDEPLPLVGTLGFRVQRYGMLQWGDLFTARQKVALISALGVIRSGSINAREPLVFACTRLADKNASLVSWDSGRETIGHVFNRQALPIVWDFVESSFSKDSDHVLGNAIDILYGVIENISRVITRKGQVTLSDACNSPLPTDSANIWFTDPPYYDAVPYADLSDFFFVWLKRLLPPEHRFFRDPFDYANRLTPKRCEAVQDETKCDNRQPKDRAWFEDTMARAFAEGCRVLHGDGVGSVVFAHKTTEGWEALISGLIRGGWTITASWPIATERPGRLRARESAALATSVHLVCRPRPEDAPVGDWGAVLRELPKRVGDWMERLQGEGVRGADLVFACIGPALEIFSRYAKVETAEGREVGLPEYLEKVWEVVGRTALEQVLGTAEAKARNGAAGALEEDARLTALFLWTLQSTNGEELNHRDAECAEEDSEDEEETVSNGKSKGFSLVFDVVRRFAQPLGIELTRWEGRIIDTKKGMVRLLPVSERARQLFGRDGREGSVHWFEPDSQDGIQLTLFPEFEGKKPPKVRGRAQKVTLDAKGVEFQAERDATTLDRIHAAMLLQAGGQTGALRELITIEQERGPDFLRLANALSALYPRDSEEKRLLDAMLLAVPR
jgi:adenine-specific DNA methylase